MLNLVREGEEDYIEAIRYRRRLKIFENFLLSYEMDLVSLSYTWLIFRCAQMLFSMYFCQTRGGRSGYIMAPLRRFCN